MSSRAAEPLYIQCRPSSLAVTRSIVLFTPNGLLQRTQWKGSSSLSTRAVDVAARKSSCGTSEITFSGQVALQRPHCTQASSEKRSIGLSLSAVSAPVGQAETQARQSVQPSTLSSTLPNGASGGSAITLAGAGDARCSSRSASRMTSRLAPIGEDDAGRGGGAAGAIARSVSPSVSGSSVSIVAVRPGLKPRPARIGSASAIVL